VGRTFRCSRQASPRRVESCPDSHSYNDVTPLRRMSLRTAIAPVRMHLGTASAGSLCAPISLRRGTRPSGPQPRPVSALESHAQRRRASAIGGSGPSCVSRSPNARHLDTRLGSAVRRPRRQPERVARGDEVLHHRVPGGNPPLVDEQALVGLTGWFRPILVKRQGCLSPGQSPRPHRPRPPGGWKTLGG
jgi:hypothetical protein